MYNRKDIMKEVGEFQIFCPKAEQLVPTNGTFEVDIPALAHGEQILLDCDYAQSGQIVRKEQFGPIGLRMLIVDGKDLIIVKGGINKEKGTVDARLNCGHCGNQVDLSFPNVEGNTSNQ